ncbi:MAG: YIP1 family protein, partial [Verrucomicrobia bacterium]|nr:YIP1 family protein [Verrucomicrobiota bacterium]
PGKIIRRIKNLVIQPAQEWEAIREEKLSVATMFTEYLLVMAAVPALANFIGYTVVGLPVAPGLQIRVDPIGGLTAAVFRYGLSLGAVYVTAFVIHKLAPVFDAERDWLAAFKLSAFTYLPIWGASILLVVPLFGRLLVLLSLYSIYIFYVGMQKLMRHGGDKTIPFMVVPMLTVLILSWLIYTVSAELRGI